MDRIESAFFRYGVSAGIPFSLLDNASNTFRAAGSPSEFLKRRRIAEKINQKSSWSDLISKRRGLVTMAPGNLPGSHEVIALAREKIEERRVRSAAGIRKTLS